MPQLEISSVNDHSCCSRCKIFEQWKSALCTLKLLGYKSFRRNSLCWCSSKLLQLTIQINCPVSLIHVIIWQMTITNCSKNGGWMDTALLLLISPTSYLCTPFTWSTMYGKFNYALGISFYMLASLRKQSLIYNLCKVNNKYVFFQLKLLQIYLWKFLNQGIWSRSSAGNTSLPNSTKLFSERVRERYSRKTENNARQLFGYIFTTCRLRAHQILNCQLDSPHTHRDRPTHWLTSTFGPFLCVRGSIQFWSFDDFGFVLDDDDD